MFGFLVLAVLCFGSSQCAPKTLPHRPVDSLTNWGQGQNPSKDNCPDGRIALYVENLFLECQ